VPKLISRKSFKINKRFSKWASRPRHN
jgi:hypothetical protein